MNAWPDGKSKPPARRKLKVKDEHIGLRVQPKEPRKVKRKEKSRRKETGGEEECKVGQREWLRTEVMHRRGL